MLTPHRKRYLNRRVRKQVFNWVGTPGDWLLIRDRLFVYDGWNVVLELNGLDHNAVDAKYTWGLDLSGSLQGAGGLGPGAPGLGTEDLTGTVANAAAIVLNGQNQHVNVPDDPALRFGNTSFTLEAWVRLASCSFSRMLLTYLATVRSCTSSASAIS